ncbi:glycosyl hydrolase family 76-domain-containing protein [Pterulicium gracile]|uniref:Glycosyl hydrolase family 76-domain-containing protein n=1 Tax=Pterulicium gracile TaxID=1884261 RepID=A0A5C3Q2C5_9AGAR|nr:glycosyl hydrolase family 76-domain-containing protein [Pterula gracilis]
MYSLLALSKLALLLLSCLNASIASPTAPLNRSAESRLTKRQDPPTGCSEFDFAGWTKEWAEKTMENWDPSCSRACWNDVDWQNHVGFETMLDYIWQSGLKDTEVERLVLASAPRPDLIGMSGDSHDDALWGALMLMKMGDYLAEVHGDADAREEHYQTGIDVINWVAESRHNDPCAPGVFWTHDERYKNTVTNAQWMHANLRVHVKTGEEKYLTDAFDVLNNFMDHYDTLKNAEGLYADGLNDECTSTGHPQTWTYNQGVMLSTFGLLYKATGEQQYFDRGNELINAVRTSSSANGVLVEVMCDEEGTCNFDQEGFKGIFSKHMQYFYDFVGPDAHSSLVDANGSPHSDWIGQNARGVRDNAQREDGHLGRAWFSGDVPQNYTPWTLISGLSAGIAAAKYGTCTQ